MGYVVLLSRDPHSFTERQKFALGSSHIVSANGYVADRFLRFGGGVAEIVFNQSVDGVVCALQLLDGVDELLAVVSRGVHGRYAHHPHDLTRRRVLRRNRLYPTGYHESVSDHVNPVAFQDPMAVVKAAHSSINFYQLWTRRRHLHFHVKHAVFQPDLRAALVGRGDELSQLVLAETGRHASGSFREGPRSRWTVVRDIRCQEFPFKYDQIHVMLRTLDDLHDHHAVSVPQTNARVVRLTGQVISEAIKYFCALRKVMTEFYTDSTGSIFQLKHARQADLFHSTGKIGFVFDMDTLLRVEVGSRKVRNVAGAQG